jgi:hypothetical protein
MTRAMAAVFKARISNVISELRLEPDEVARVGADLLVFHGRRAGLDRRGLHALVEDQIEANAVDEGRGRAPR